MDGSPWGRGVQRAPGVVGGEWRACRSTWSSSGTLPVPRPALPRLCQHQRPQHAGEEGQRDGRHRAGQRHRALRHGRPGAACREVRAVPAAALLQVGVGAGRAQGGDVGTEQGCRRGLLRVNLPPKPFKSMGCHSLPRFSSAWPGLCCCFAGLPHTAPVHSLAA